MMSRRQAMVLCGCGAIQLLSSNTVPKEDGAGVSKEPLRAHAARRGLSFGIGVYDEQVRRGGRPMQLVAQEADCIVACNALKWGQTEHILGRPDYIAAERAVRFAEQNRLRMRGHTAFWYRNLPAKISQSLNAPETPGLFLKHVGDVVGHFRGRIWEWDVVNEALEPNDKMPGLLRKAPFGKMDYGYLADIFTAAHEADPAAKLYYNDYALEGTFPFEFEKRKAAITLLTELRRRGAPVHGIGLQSHLATHFPFDTKIFRAFLAELAGMGLEIRLTEFDVSDRRAFGSVEDRDQAVADLGHRYLDVAFAEPAVKGLLCWGLSDKDSFYNAAYCNCRHENGSMQRPLPFDDNYARKPLWYAMARAFDGAPRR